MTKKGEAVPCERTHNRCKFPRLKADVKYGGCSHCWVRSKILPSKSRGESAAIEISNKATVRLNRRSRVIE